MLVFLDIDGVMVPAKGWKSPEMLPDGFPAFSKRASNTLQLLTRDNATIVLTTSHQSSFTIPEWRSLLAARGVNSKRIRKLGSTTVGQTRKEELLAWFSRNTVDEPFVILDDDRSLIDLPPDLKKHLVLTSPYIGLTEEHLHEIEIILGQAHTA